MRVPAAQDTRKGSGAATDLAVQDDGALLGNRGLHHQTGRAGGLGAGYTEGRQDSASGGGRLQRVAQMGARAQPRAGGSNRRITGTLKKWMHMCIDRGSRGGSSIPREERHETRNTPVRRAMVAASPRHGRCRGTKRHLCIIKMHH